MKLAGADGADRAGDGVAKRTVRSSEPGRGKGTDSADVPGSLSQSEYRRAKRLFDSTMPGLWPDARRLEHSERVRATIANPRAAK